VISPAYTNRGILMDTVFSLCLAAHLGQDFILIFGWRNERYDRHLVNRRICYMHALSRLMRISSRTNCLEWCNVAETLVRFEGTFEQIVCQKVDYL
jgi:hypothetical protein